jgi:hypothetical protein
MSLSATLSLKKDDGTSEDYVTVDQLPSQPGTLRRNTSIDAPEQETLLVRSQATGSGSSKGQRHTLSINNTIANGSGVLITGSASISLVFPNDPAFTPQMMIDMLHQLTDVIVAPVSNTAFDVDDAVVKQLLRGES